MFNEETPQGFAFNLDDLQREAGRKHGLDADSTFEAAKQLYERGFISYPLTAVRELPEDMWESTAKIVLEHRYATRIRTYTPDYKSPGWTKGETGPTHGIVLTSISAAALFGGGDSWTLAQRQVYELIHRQVLEMFRKPAELSAE